MFKIFLFIFFLCVSSVTQASYIPDDQEQQAENQLVSYRQSSDQDNFHPLFNNDILEEIASYLDLTDLVELSFVNQKLYKLLNAGLLFPSCIELSTQQYEETIDNLSLLFGGHKALSILDYFQQNSKRRYGVVLEKLSFLQSNEQTSKLYYSFLETLASKTKDLWLTVELSPFYEIVFFNQNNENLVNFKEEQYKLLVSSTFFFSQEDSPREYFETLQNNLQDLFVQNIEKGDFNRLTVIADIIVQNVRNMEPIYNTVSVIEALFAFSNIESLKFVSDNVFSCEKKKINKLLLIRDLSKASTPQKVQKRYKKETKSVKKRVVSKTKKLWSNNFQKKKK